MLYARRGLTWTRQIEKVGARITAALLERGVIGRAMPQSDILGFAPPLCLTRVEADTIVAATKDAVEAVTATLYPMLP